MTFIAYSIKRKRKDEYWEKFAKNGNRKSISPSEITNKHSKVKKICITCLKVETYHFNSKFCQSCWDLMPKMDCTKCFKKCLESKTGVCTVCYYKNRSPYGK